MEMEYLQKLKSRLDALLMDLPVNSPEIISLSCEIDELIVEYYKTESHN